MGFLYRRLLKVDTHMSEVYDRYIIMNQILEGYRFGYCTIWYISNVNKGTNLKPFKISSVERNWKEILEEK